jgi:hypothetical protein
MFVPLVHLQQEISKASDEVAKKYYDKTPEEERTSLEVIAMMRATAKSKQWSFKGQFSKYIAIVYLYPSHFFSKIL